MSCLQVYCQHHEGQICQFIDLTRQYTQQQLNRLACSECFFFKKANQSECIPLHKAIREPQEFLSKLLTPQSFQSLYLSQLFSICEQNLEKMFKEQEDKFIELDCIVEQIKQLLAEQRSKLKKLQEELQKDKELLLEVQRVFFKQNIKFKEMVECVKNLQNCEDEFENSDYKKYLNRFSVIITEMQNTNCSQMIQIINQMRAKQNQMSQELKLTDIQPFQLKFEGILDNYKSFIDNTYFQYYPVVKNLPQSNIAHKSFLLYLIGIVNEKQNKQVQSVVPLYVGSKDGLGYSQFWSKVGGYSNCLIIFKSNYDAVFGGYTPCPWAKSNGDGTDYNCYSFLFTQLNWAIYPLKAANFTKAIIRNMGCGPIFGDYDIYIPGNFQGCSSALGTTYQYEPISKGKKQMLLGASTANIVECEVYQLS